MPTSKDKHEKKLKYLKRSNIQVDASDREKAKVKYLYKVLNKIYDGARPGTSNKRQVVVKNNKKLIVPSLSDNKVSLLKDVIRKNKYALLELFKKYYFVSAFEKFFIKYLNYKFPHIRFYMLTSKQYNIDNDYYNDDDNPFYYRVPNFNPKETLFIYLTLRFDEFAHATFVHYNAKKKTFKFYDPNGGKKHHTGSYIGMSRATNWYMQDLEKYMKQKYPNESFKYVPASEACNQMGLQPLEDLERHFITEVEDLNGYCVTYTLLMMYLCALNNSDNFKLLEDLVVKAYPPGNELSNYIREYFLFVMNLVYKVAAFGNSLESSEVKDYYIGDFFSKNVIGCVVHDKHCAEMREFYNKPYTFIKKKYDLTVAQLLVEDLEFLSNIVYNSRNGDEILIANEADLLFEKNLTS